MEQKENIETEKLLEEANSALKEIFVAKIHKCEDGLKIKFPNGQTFTLALWESKGKSMNSTIKKIYNRVLEDFRKEPLGKAHQAAKEERDRAYSALEASLNEEQKKLLSALSLAEGGVRSVLERWLFESGFIAGMRMELKFGEEEK